MTCYAGIDLHSNNNVICVIDGKDKRLLEKKLDNDADLARLDLEAKDLSYILDSIRHRRFSGAYARVAARRLEPDG